MLVAVEVGVQSCVEEGIGAGLEVEGAVDCGVSAAAPGVVHAKLLALVEQPVHRKSVLLGVIVVWKQWMPAPQKVDGLVLATVGDEVRLLPVGSCAETVVDLLNSRSVHILASRACQIGQTQDPALVHFQRLVTYLADKSNLDWQRRCCCMNPRRTVVADDLEPSIVPRCDVQLR